MKTILKMFGMPRTGTNLLHWLMVLNFRNYVCAKSEHDEDHLGWKHGVPRNLAHYLELENMIGESVRFVFTTREYESWRASYCTKHFGSWENPSRYAVLKDGVIFCTPIGMEIYKNHRELYDTKMGAYEAFCRENPYRAMIIPFELLTKDQERAVIQIRDRFGLEMTHKEVVTLPKQLTSQGVFIDMRPTLTP